MVSDEELLAQAEACAGGWYEEGNFSETSWIADKDAAFIVAASPATIKALLKRLAEAEAGWQPIETAPRDGTAILLWPFSYCSVWQGTADAEVVCGFFDTGEEEWSNPEERRQFAPTHWRPLPAPP